MLIYLQSKVMLKGLAGYRGIEIFGIPNAADFAAKVYKGQFAPPTVLIFKYNYFDSAGISRKSSGNGAAGGGVGQVTEQPAATTTGATITAEDIEYADSLNSWVGFYWLF